MRAVIVAGAETDARKWHQRQLRVGVAPHGVEQVQRARLVTSTGAAVVAVDSSEYPAGCSRSSCGLDGSCPRVVDPAL